MLQENTAQKKYFAAANSYGGFVSYFDQVFEPNDYSRIFILKGGPGTGKNSFMREIAEHFSKKGCDTEEIYCSSDPRSLDGVIVSQGEGKIAVIDGTSPHERDTRIPGAVDEIINLGENWDSRWLIGNREKICALNSEKKSAYKAAYSYLNIGKGAFDYIKETYKAHFDREEAEKRSKELINGFTPSKKYKSIRLISSFSKNGLASFDTVEKLSDKHIKIGGDPITSMLFLNTFRDTAYESEVSLQQSPYPLSGDLCEAVYLPENSACITTTDESVYDVYSDDFSKKMTELVREKIKAAQKIEIDAREEAQRWLLIASDLHFRLEDIYSEAMDFKENERLILKAIEKIEIIFDEKK